MTKLETPYKIRVLMLILYGHHEPGGENIKLDEDGSRKYVQPIISHFVTRKRSWSMSQKSKIIMIYHARIRLLLICTSAAELTMDPPAYPYSRKHMLVESREKTGRKQRSVASQRESSFLVVLKR